MKNILDAYAEMLRFRAHFMLTDMTSEEETAAVDRLYALEGKVLEPEPATAADLALQVAVWLGECPVDPVAMGERRNTAATMRTRIRALAGLPSFPPDQLGDVE